MSSEQVNSALASSVRKEGLLPTPPSHQMVTLDTSLTCKYCIKFISVGVLAHVFSSTLHVYLFCLLPTVHTLYKLPRFAFQFFVL